MSRLILFSLLILAKSTALADWDLAASVGYGKRSNPLVDSSAIETVINIDVAWYGKRAFFDNGDVGFNLIDTAGLQVNTIAQINNERAFFSKTNTRFVSIGGDVVNTDVPDSPTLTPDETNDPVVDEGNGDDAGSGGDEGSGRDDRTIRLKIPNRNYALEAGLEAIKPIGKKGNIYAAVLSDISNTHRGSRVHLSYQNTWLHKRWATQLNTGAKWQSAALNTYYFGVTTEESNAVRPQYRANSGTNLYGSVLFSYAISPKLFWGTRVAYERFGDSIANSPIIEDKGVYTLFSGVKYKF